MSLLLGGIIVLTLFCAVVVFPAFFNKGINFFNAKIAKPMGFSLPLVPEKNFKLGLDLQGGTRLIYEADLSGIEDKEKGETMQGLRDVIERRVNYFGVREPLVQVEERAGHQRLVVELAGIKSVEEAIKMIGETPFLEFREEREKAEQEQILKQLEEAKAKGAIIVNPEDPYFKPTKLTGKYFKKAQLGFNQTTLEPEVLLEFNSEGAQIFAELTAKNVGKRLAIYVDNVLISAPVVREEISGGKAQITGKFTLQEAKELVRNLNAGALPVPIRLVSQTTVGPSLGKVSLQKSLKAALVSFLIIAGFMIGYYRFSGFLAVLSLLIYSLLLLAVFKLLPVTLTLAGIGGAILSMGMAVDANILIFERQKEERKLGESFSRIVSIGFSRAWPSIRDSNFTTVLIALIMFYFGTSFVKGFALTLTLGIITSMLTALLVTRLFFSLFIGTKLEKYPRLWQ